MEKPIHACSTETNQTDTKGARVCVPSQLEFPDKVLSPMIQGGKLKVVFTIFQFFVRAIKYISRSSTPALTEVIMYG